MDPRTWGHGNRARIRAHRRYRVPGPARADHALPEPARTLRRCALLWLLHDMSAQDTPIWARPCPHYPELHVMVSRTPIGTYRVTFRDADADATIEQRIFNKCVPATEYAHLLLNQP